MTRPAVIAGELAAALDVLRSVRSAREFAIALCWLRGQEIAARRDGRRDAAEALAAIFAAFVAGVAAGGRG